MKYLIYFLLFSTVVFSQNYHYALEEAQVKPANVPTGFVASQITKSTVNLAWIAPSDSTPISEYRIYNKNILLATSVGTGITYKIVGLSPETAYSLTVRAVYYTGTISGDSNIQSFITASVPGGVNNQLEEIEYFKAYLLPLAQKGTLQKALDTYGSVRLEKGDYSGVNVVMKSNQRLYGHPSSTSLANITIAAGSSNVILENFSPAPNKELNIIFQAGGAISNCIIKSMLYSNIKAKNASIDSCTLINIIGSISFDCSESGYFRNNKIIKHQAQGTSNMLVMKGNYATPSYGNVNLHSNYLTSTGVTTDLDNLQSSTFLGIDCETYGGLTRELFYAKNIGKLNLAVVQGAIQYNTNYGYANIDAMNVNFLTQNGAANSNSILSSKSNLFSLNSTNKTIRSDGAEKGFALIRDVNSNDIFYSGVIQNKKITDQTTISKLTNSILGTKYSPWDKPKWETLPDPLGANWKTDRTGKPDQTSYIQGLINKNGVAELPEGVFYIGSTLNIPLDKAHGLIGQGTGKTVICGLTDDFPLISITDNIFGSFTLSNLTLQGGSSGLYATSKNMLWAYQTVKFIVFRNQNNGIQLHEIFGFDNNFFDNVSFINCNKGVFQDALVPFNPNVLAGWSYIDKTLFYNSQFINCDTGLSFNGKRANNMNAWVDCKFDGGSQAFDGGGDSTIFANCEFSKYTGNSVISINQVSIFNSKFYNNSVKVASISSISSDFEGCNFSDNSNLLASNPYNSLSYRIINSTVTGNALVSGSKPSNAVFVNSTFSANSTLSKLLVNLKEGVPTVIIDAKSNPYPQLLVTQ